MYIKGDAISHINKVGPQGSFSLKSQRFGLGQDLSLQFRDVGKLYTGGLTAFLTTYNKVSRANEALNGTHCTKHMQTKAKAAAEMI